MRDEKNVLVAIQFDARGRELLSWAVVKAADPGDHVYAVHVCRNSDDALNKKLLLDCYLEAYKGLCEVKKVGLTGGVLTGNSVRRSLVREAKNCSAVVVVLGMSKKAPLGGLMSVTWMPLDRYCAKHLPPTTEVLTVHNGKVVFRRSTNDQQSAGIGEDPKPSICKMERMSSTVAEIESEFGDSEVSLGQWFEDESISMADVAPKKKQGHSRSMSQCPDNVSEQMRGWPLLRKASLPSQNVLDARKMSVVQWVLGLPDRAPAELTLSSLDWCSSKSESPQRRDFSVHSSVNSLSLWSEVLEELGLPHDVESLDLTWFSYDVLRTSTSQFASENLIGKGGCSQVYKGVLPDGKLVAVKVMKVSKEAWKDFSLEISIISSLKHESIIPLVGLCIQNDELISVYDFMEKGSLEQNLHECNSENFVLPWETRFKIALGVAKALNHLHSRLPKPVIHRDVKSANILLCDGYEPKLSDFGLAVWGPTSSSSETYDDVVGTFGYLAPEYFMYGKVSDKIDVYSFGVVLLELLSGKKPIGSSSSKGHQSLVMWAQPILESGKLREILDPDLEGNHDESQMQRMILAATLCLTRSARRRPKMSQVLELLEGEETVENWINSHVDEQEESIDVIDDEVYVNTSIKSHLSLVLLNEDDDFASRSSSVEQSTSPSSLEEYLKGRWSRSSSFH